MSSEAGETTHAENITARLIERHIDHVPTAFVVTRGAQHALVYANEAFRTLVGSDDGPLLGRPMSAAFVSVDTTALTLLLDRVFRSGDVARNRRIGPLDASGVSMSCTVWPEPNAAGTSEHLVIELRVATQGELALALQQEVAERLLLSALREQEAAHAAEELRRGAAFLAAEGRRLADSLDEGSTLHAITEMSLPYLGGWCIVDIRDDDDSMHRLAIVHPDPAMQTVIDALEGRWCPHRDERFGLPAMLRSATLEVITHDDGEALATAAHSQEIVQVLHALGSGPLLTVPLVIRERVVGAVTFVGGRTGRPFTRDDVKLAEDLAERSAMALDRARLYGEAITLRIRAESASEAKSAFLGMMSHELRTPLNAIGGYVDLIDMELRGPVTEEQHIDLARIRSNQRYLAGLITDLLNLTKMGGGRLDYEFEDVNVCDILTAGVALVEPLIAQKRLIFDGITCDPTLLVRGDREKILQVLVNLLSNAIKFTPPEGRLTLGGDATEHAVTLRVCDTGIGIPADKLEAIFEPFVQVNATSLGPEGGVGLGLSISRSIARDMQGDLTVESTVGEGACFTLTLPNVTGTGGGDVAQLV